MIPLPSAWVALALALAPVRVPATGPGDPLPAGRVDTLVADAGVALARGRPWEATRLITPVLADSGHRTANVLMLAATAASRWGGWPEVSRLLEGQLWLDNVPGGAARLLLARAALEQGRDSTALLEALAAEPDATPGAEGERLVLLASALERLGARDSAASTYLRAAARLPSVADWLRVHAAAVTDDGASRAAIYAAVADPLARDRVPWSEAAAHRRTGDLVGAAAEYRALGARAAALRLRLQASPDSARHAEVRRDLVALIGARRSPGEVREAVALLDSAFSPLAPVEELEVGRAAATAGIPARAIAAFERAFGAGLGTGADRFAWATALTRLGRNGEAALQFARVRRPDASRELAASAAYQAARALVRAGELERGGKALLVVVRLQAGDTAAASSALFLLGDLASDDRQDSTARDRYRRLLAKYPTSRLAPAAGFRAGIIALVGGDPRTAAVELDELARRFPGSDEAPAATYWAGRAWQEAGDTSAAAARWERLATGDPASYYTAAALRRLGREAWAPPARPDSFVPTPGFDSAMARASLLGRLGLGAESRWEYDRLLRLSDTSSERLLALAAAFRREGLASQAIQLARRAVALGAPADARTYRLLYPVMLEDALLAEAAERELDPGLVAAVIRQESMFNPAATSPAGARGLMQVMPEVGTRLARSLDFPVWDPVLLYQPDVSLQLGAYHLRELSDRYADLVHVLAAYNAGASRVERWSQRAGVEDPEVFTDRIPFVETRSYVRAILRNQEVYRMLYPWTAP